MEPKILALEAATFLGVTVQAIHKHLKSKNLPFIKTQNRIYFGHNTAKELFKLKFKQKTVAIQIVKGGTGKTSLAHAIAIKANLYGARVLCIDKDQQGNLTQAFQVNPEKIPVMIDVLNDEYAIEDCIVNISDGLDLIPSRIENAVLDNVLMIQGLPLDRVYKERFDRLRNSYDLIILDCPPALGQSVTAATLASDLVISPVTPEKFSLSGLKVTGQEIINIEKKFKVDIPLNVLLNKFDSRTTLSHETLTSLIKHPIYGSKMFKSYIRASQEFPNAIAQGRSIYDGLKRTTAQEDIELVTKEILGLIDTTNHKEIQISLGSLEENETQAAIAV